MQNYAKFVIQIFSFESIPEFKMVNRLTNFLCQGILLAVKMVYLNCYLGCICAFKNSIFTYHLQKSFYFFIDIFLGKFCIVYFCYVFNKVFHLNFLIFCPDENKCFLTFFNIVNSKPIHVLRKLQIVMPQTCNVSLSS